MNKIFALVLVITLTGCGGKSPPPPPYEEVWSTGALLCAKQRGGGFFSSQVCKDKAGSCYLKGGVAVKIACPSWATWPTKAL